MRFSLFIKFVIQIAKSLHVSTDYLLFGISEAENKNNEGKEDVLIELLNKCTDRERKIAEEILKLLVTYIK